MSAAPAISVVIPVRNGAKTLPRCLEALDATRGIAWECIVVDDGSTDDSVAIARQWGAVVERTELPGSGPARARNRGALVARAPLIGFVDADVLVRPETLAAFAAVFAADAEVVAAFGSYDATPAAPGFLSQYRNLLHHFVHQTSHEDASTFWSGCGAIRRSVFLDAGGFDPSYARPSIEDIELGYRLHAAGARIRLAKHIQVTHLKRWTLWGILQTDVRDRALPWTDLIYRTHYLPNDLNLQTGGRVSALSVFALVGLTILGFWKPWGWPAALAPLTALLTFNRRLYAFFLQRGGRRFLLAALLMHWFYYAYSSVAFALGMSFAHLQGGPSRLFGIRWLVTTLSGRI